MSLPKFRIAICGGGIGGLMLANVLHKFSKQDVQVELYESKDRFAEVGAGVSVYKRTWSIFQLLGLDEALGKMAISPPVEEPRPGFAFKRGDQLEENQNFYQIISPYGSITLHRADLLKVLTDSLPASFKAHFNKRLVKYTQESTGTMKMFFADGTTAEPDISVGADGFKSPTRETMYRNLAKTTEGQDAEIAKTLFDFINPTWTGYYAFRSITDTETLLSHTPGHQAAKTPMIYFGKNKHIVTYPISHGKYVNISSVVRAAENEGERDGPYMTEIDVTEMTERYGEWHPEVQQIMKNVEKASRWAICQVRDLPSFVSSHVALLGDAAHAMSPNLGAGAGQAIEDAHLLGRILTDDRITVSTLDEALRVYDNIRRPIATRVADLSRTTGFCFDFNYTPDSAREEGVEITSPRGLQMLADEVYNAWSFHWTGLPSDDWDRAVQMLDDITISSASAGRV